MMTQIQWTKVLSQTEWDNLYTKLYDAYEYSGLRNETVRHKLGLLLDYMIQLNVCPNDDF